MRKAFGLYATGTCSDSRLVDDVGLTEAGLTEILTNPLSAGRTIRREAKPDEEEKPTRFRGSGRPGALRVGSADPRRAAHGCTH